MSGLCILSKLLCHGDGLFKDLPDCFLKQLYHLLSLPVLHEGSPFSTSLLILGILSFSYSYPVSVKGYLIVVPIDSSVMALQ